MRQVRRHRPTRLPPPGPRGGYAGRTPRVHLAFVAALRADCLEEISGPSSTPEPPGCVHTSSRRGRLLPPGPGRPKGTIDEDPPPHPRHRRCRRRRPRRPGHRLPPPAATTPPACPTTAPAWSASTPTSRARPSAPRRSAASSATPRSSASTVGSRTASSTASATRRALHAVHRLGARPPTSARSRSSSTARPSASTSTRSPTPCGSSATPARTCASPSATATGPPPRPSPTAR